MKYYWPPPYLICIQASHCKLLSIFCYLLLITTGLHGQRPVTQIEGRLEVYDNLDSTSIYIGKGTALVSETLPAYPTNMLSFHDTIKIPNGPHNVYFRLWSWT